MEDTPQLTELEDPLPSGSGRRSVETAATRRIGMAPRLADTALNHAKRLDEIGRPESQDRERGSVPLAVQAVVAELGRSARRAASGGPSVA